MNSRERLRCALEHREGDCVPIDFGAMRSTGINTMAYGELRQYLKLPDLPVKVYDLFQQLADPDEDVRRLFGADVIQLHRLKPSFGYSIGSWKEGVLDNGMPCLYPEEYAPAVNQDGEREIRVSGRVYAKMPKGGLYYDSVYHPLQTAKTKEEIDRIPTDFLSDEEMAYLRAEAKRLFETTEYGILGAFGGNIFESGQGDFGFEEYFSHMALEPEFIHHYHEKICQVHLANLEKYLEAVGDYIDVIQFGDDLGMQQAPQISVSMYREMIKPYHQTLFQFVRKHYPRVKVFLHSCGAIAPLIPDLIDAGVEVLNPVQISAAGMKPEFLKREYGAELTFWGGGVSTQTTVAFGSVAEIEEEVRRNLEIFAPGGGYVFTQVHNLQAGTAPEKIAAIYKAANRWRSYRRESR